MPLLRQHPILRHLLAIALLCALWLLFFWRILTPHPPDRVVFDDLDFTQHYYAFASYQVDRLWQGEFPLWNPYNHAGDPFAGNIQFAAFYPPRLMGALLWGGDGYSLEDYQLETALHVLLASLMMYVFLNLYSHRVLIALVGSALYAYSGYLTSYPLFQVSVIGSAIWLPLLLAGIHLSVTRGRWWVAGCVLGAIAIALSLLGGHPQTTMYITYLGVAYLFYQGWQQNLQIVPLVMRLLLLGGISAGLSAIQLLPSLEFSRLSSRVADYGYADKANGFQLIEWLHLFVPGVWTVISPLYVGTAGLLLALMGALRGSGMRVFWVVVAIVSLLVSLGGNGFAYDLFYLLVPGFNVFRQQERIAILVSFALVMLAVEGLLWWQSAAPKQRRRWVRIAGIYAAVMASVALLVVIGSALPGEPFIFAAVMALLMVGWMAWSNSSRVALGLLLALIVVDLFIINMRQPGYQPDTAEHRVQLAEPLRDLVTASQDIRWRVDGAAGLQGFGAYFRIPDIYGTGPFDLASIDALRSIPVDRFWEVLSVRYVTTFEEPPAGVAVRRVGNGVNYDGREYQILDIEDPRPMAHLVYDSRDAGGNADFARQIMADSRVNLREMAITLHPLPVALPVTRPTLSEVYDLKLVTPERWEMTVSTGAPALLTLALVAYPGWEASINEQPADLLSMNGGLTGLLLDAGEDQAIIVEYRPASVYAGSLITLASSIAALLLIGGSWWVRRPTR